jgi:hypothetical protein
MAGTNDDASDQVKAAHRYIQARYASGGNGSNSNYGGGGGGGHYSYPGGAGGGSGSASRTWVSSGGSPPRLAQVHYAGSQIQFVGGGGSGGGGGGIGLGNLVQGMNPVSMGFSRSEIVPETALAAGAVHVYRWWTLIAPDFSLSPARADSHWDPERTLRLHGVYASWQPGVNHAVCLSGWRRHEEGHIPYRDCGCGYWGYWRAQEYPLDTTVRERIALPVFGVIKGWGRTLFGDEGVRCEKARIVALHVPLVFSPAAEREDPWTRAGFTGNVLYMNGAPRYSPREPDAGEQAWFDAWSGVISDRLEQMYPGARLFETPQALMRVFPRDPAADDLQRQRQQQQEEDCLYCNRIGEDPDVLRYSCPSHGRPWFTLR